MSRHTWNASARNTWCHDSKHFNIHLTKIWRYVTELPWTLWHISGSRQGHPRYIGVRQGRPCVARRKPPRRRPTTTDDKTKTSVKTNVLSGNKCSSTNVNIHDSRAARRSHDKRDVKRVRCRLVDRIELETSRIIKKFAQRRRNVASSRKTDQQNSKRGPLPRAMQERSVKNKTRNRSWAQCKWHCEAGDDVKKERESHQNTWRAVAGDSDNEFFVCSRRHTKGSYVKRCATSTTSAKTVVSRRSSRQSEWTNRSSICACHCRFWKGRSQAMKLVPHEHTQTT